jgi:hypothetical protein
MGTSMSGAVGAGQSSRRPDKPAEASVTRERFLELALSIKQIDSRFHDKRLSEVLRTYPSLDRVMRNEKQAK